ncbi:hypothetical protein [Mongoliibacter ruber]|uniref:Uncharacterized protein n=1 Tax=Mongoliibacter ruber TaxID=1750599 RepID=A0A2T0WVA4_9BACT|nr:hypothetical protein [Mongoliibacter ruber]PRY90610.1 hypothetical protein CLW00_101274 [Mongoliibacter ruber]
MANSALIEKVPAKLNAIDSLESYPMGDRLFMILRLDQGPSLTIYKEGRDAKDEEIGTALWLYHQALNKAESQIEVLLKMIKELELEEYELEDYLEEFPDTDSNYRLQELKANLYMSMAREDEKNISRYINEIHLMAEREVSNG